MRADLEMDEAICHVNDLEPSLVRMRWTAKSAVTKEPELIKRSNADRTSVPVHDEVEFKTVHGSGCLDELLVQARAGMPEVGLSTGGEWEEVDGDVLDLGGSSDTSCGGSALTSAFRSLRKLGSSHHDSSDTGKLQIWSTIIITLGLTFSAEVRYHTLELIGIRSGNRRDNSSIRDRWPEDLVAMEQSMCSSTKAGPKG